MEYLKGGNLEMFMKNTRLTCGKNFEDPNTKNDAPDPRKHRAAITVG
jgi:hypothetical protein